MAECQYHYGCFVILALLINWTSAAGQQSPSKIVDHVTAELLTQQPLKMSIYYETLCPDSLDFLENQLLNVLSIPDGSGSRKNLESFVDLELIPYGNGMTFEAKAQTPIEKFSFICQHGPLECEGNKMHSCVLKYVSKVPEIRSLKLIKFLTCSMKHLMSSPKASIPPPRSRNLSSIIHPVFESCFAEFELQPELSSTVKPEIEKCLQDGEGSSLLKINGDLTSQIIPKHYFVPWITFNGIWKRRLMEEGLRDLKKVLCQLVIKSSLASALLTNQEIQGCEIYYPSIGAAHLLKQAPSGNEMSLLFGNSFDETPEIRTRDGRGAVHRIGGSNGKDRKRFVHAEMDMIPYGAWRVQANQRGREWQWRRPIAR